MIEKPTFKKGNKWFVDALNTLADYAERHGIQPNGMPGWRETPKGWHPPASVSAEGGELRRWDLIPELGDEGEPTGKLILFNPTVKPIGSDVEASDEITNDAFSPEAGRWLVIHRENDGDPWLVEQKTTWNGFPSPFEFEEVDPYSLLSTTFPVWRFYDEDGPLRVSLGEDIFGEKLVRSEVLRGVPGLVKVPEVNFWRAVTYLL